MKLQKILSSPLMGGEVIESRPPLIGGGHRIKTPSDGGGGHRILGIIPGVYFKWLKTSIILKKFRAFCAIFPNFPTSRPDKLPAQLTSRGHSLITTSKEANRK